MRQCIEICRACGVSYPQPLLTCGFGAGIVALALCPQSICSFEMEASAVNGKPVICGNSLVLGTASVPFAVIPVPVVAGAYAGF